MSLYERICWNVLLNGQKLQQLTDTAKVNTHNLSHTHSLNTVQNECQTGSQTNRFGLSLTDTDRNCCNTRLGDERKDSEQGRDDKKIVKKKTKGLIGSDGHEKTHHVLNNPSL